MWGGIKTYNACHYNSSRTKEDVGTKAASQMIPTALSFYLGFVMGMTPTTLTILTSLGPGIEILQISTAYSPT